MNTTNPIQQATVTALATIRAYWPGSANPPRDTAPPGRTPPRSRPPAHHPIVRADAVTTLAFWVEALAGEYPDALPAWLKTSARDGMDLGDVWATTAFLEDHLHHLDEWGYLERARHELTSVAEELRQLVDQPDKDRPVLGHCHLTHDGQTPDRATAHVPRCQGTVRAVPQRDPETGTTTYEEGRCTRCKSSAVIEWWRQQWGLTQTLVTTRELVDALAHHDIKVAPATVRWWLHTGVICASGHTEDGDRLYDVAAVVFALGKRERRRASGSVGGTGSRVPGTSLTRVGG